MPTYEYRCSDCGHQLEAVQSFSDDALVDCPSCGHAALRKVFGNVGVVFKGSGFYRNDARAEAKGGKGGAAKSSPSSDGSSAGKSDNSAPKTDSGGSSSDASKSSSNGGSSNASASKESKPAAKPASTN